MGRDDEGFEGRRVGFEPGLELHVPHALARAFQQAKDAYSDNDQHDMVAEMKVNIGLVHRELGETQHALEMMQIVALENRTDLNFRQRIIKSLSNLVARLSGAKPA